MDKLLPSEIINGIKKKDDKIFNKKFIQENFTYILELYYPIGIATLLKQIKKIDGIEKIIKDNLRNIFRKSKSDDIFEVLSIVKEYKKVLKVLDKLPCYDVNSTGEDEELYSILIGKIIDPEYTLKKDKLFEFCKEVFRGVFKNEKLSMTDLKSIGNGCWSKCYRVGDTVIKLGRMRVTHEIPDHPRIIKSIYRNPMLSADQIRENKVKHDVARACGKIPARHIEYIEIMPLVETNTSMEKKENPKLDNKKYKKITKEDMYQIYKELRDAGIVWADPKLDNLGRLIKRNEVNYHGITYVDENANGMKKDKKMRQVVLEPGEIVIIDTDYIFREDDPMLKKSYRRDVLIGFEERYNKEMAERSFSR